MHTRREHRRNRRQRRVVWIVAIVVAGAMVLGGGVAAVWAVWAPNAFPAAQTSPHPTEPPNHGGDGPSHRPTSTKPPRPTPTTTPMPTPTPTKRPSPADKQCDSHVTMSVVAHYDDDLIFANPHIAHALAAGDCVRTVFLTAGDAGRGLEYARSRELGILRAYNTLRGVKNEWVETPVELDCGVKLSQWSPKDDAKVSVTFLRLPDGGLKGQGFDATGRQSLAALAAGSIPGMTTIDNGQTITRDTLLAMIVELLDAYHADDLITLTPTASADSEGDHSDHKTTGTLVREAWQAAGFDRAHVLYALGYPGKNMPPNVIGMDLEQKLAAFRIYAAQDSVSACKTDDECLKLNIFGTSLQREYLRSDIDLFGP